MKKLIKWSAILGIVFCLAGIGVITAGAMMGGVDEFGNYLGQLDNHHFDYVERSVRTPEGSVSKTPDASTVTSTAASYERVRKLKVEAGPGEVIIITEDREDPQDTAIRVEGHGVDGVLTYPYEVRQDEDELEIERSYEFRHRFGDYESKRMETLVIYIPRNYQFREVELEASAAEIEVDEIHTQKLGVEAKAGTVTVNYANAADIDAECKAGTVYVGLEGSKEQYNYELKCSAGSITLADEEEETFTALHQEKYIDNRASKKADLECAAGEILVRFTGTGQ